MGHFHPSEFDLDRFYEALEYFPVPEVSYSPSIRIFCNVLEVHHTLPLLVMLRCHSMPLLL